MNETGKNMAEKIIRGRRCVVLGNNMGFNYNTEVGRMLTLHIHGDQKGFKTFKPAILYW
jgi:hypothetical protein